MKKATMMLKILILLLGGFFVLMSFDSFDGTDSAWNMILEFFINSLPGFVLIALTLILWKKDFILGVILILGAIGLFFLFKLYREISEQWITILIVEVPMVTAGGFLMFSNWNQNNK